MQQYLQKAGIDARITVEPDSGSITVLARGDFDLVWGAYTPPFLVGYFMSEAVKTGGAANYMGFSDSRVDTLAAAQGKELDPAKRKQVIDQEQDLLFEQMPYVPVFSKLYFRFVSCQTRNINPLHFSSKIPRVEHVWLDPTGC